MIGEILLLLKDDTTLGKIADAVVAETKKESPAILAMNVELADTQLKLKNIMNAIENGIFTESTKSRLDELEKLKKKLIISLQAEQAKHPVLSKEQIIAWFHRLRTFDVKKKEHRERLIDTFINAIFLFDDKLVITFNYQNGSKTILLSDLEKSSCLNEFGRPKSEVQPNLRIFFILRAFWGFLVIAPPRKRPLFFLLKIGYDHMFDHICHEKTICHKGFRHFAIFILCKMTAILCF